MSAMEVKVLIIGAGASGLVALKCMKEAGIDALAIEKSCEIGGAFRSDLLYESLFLTISNQMMCYSDFPPEERARYWSGEEYRLYLHKYCKHFGLSEHIRLETSVSEATFANNKWSVSISDNTGAKQLITAEHLIVATGSNHEPKTIPLPGYTGDVIHSSAYRSNAPFAGKRVVIIGTGESSADIAHEIGKVAASVTLWSRRHAMIAPRYVTAFPDEFTEMAERGGSHKVGHLLESAAVSRPANLLPPWLYGAVRLLFWSVVNGPRHGVLGMLSVWSLRASSEGNDTTTCGWLRGDQAMVATKSARLAEAVLQGTVDFVVSPSVEFHGTSVRFPPRSFVNTAEVAAGQQVEADVVVLCTGYQTQFSWLKADLEWNPRTWYKHCFPPGFGDKLSFLGWTRPHQGGIPACSEMLSRYLTLLITHKRSLPADYAQRAIDEGKAEELYFGKTPGYKSLVDFPSFMDSLAALIGCRPVAPSPLRPGRLFQFISFPRWPVFYRLRGPGARPELWERVMARHTVFEGDTHTASSTIPYQELLLCCGCFSLHRGTHRALAVCVNACKKKLTRLFAAAVSTPMHIVGLACSLAQAACNVLLWLATAGWSARGGVTWGWVVKSKRGVLHGNAEESLAAQLWPWN